MEQYSLILAIALAYLLDKLLGDPLWLPHPIVGFGKAISQMEKILNKGKHRLLKGFLLVIVLVPGVFMLFLVMMKLLSQFHWTGTLAANVLFLFYGIAGTTLIKEAQMVFEKVQQSLDAGRTQVARIVGRDTSELSEQQIKAATLETLAENLSDGVIAPLFWYAVAGIPGIMTYKMINTLDSMIGYKNERYLYFGRCAAYLDDAANYIPARITALLIAFVNLNARAFSFIYKFGKAHSSPNAGYPEAALAGVLDATFGGTHNYFGKKVEKPLIGKNPKLFTEKDFKITKRTNLLCEACFIIALLTLAYFNWLDVTKFIRFI